MSDLGEARALALALPEVTEQDHHGIASFRVRGKIFATVPDEGHVRVMLDPLASEEAIAENPAMCAPFYWGKRLACVVVALAPVPRDLLAELLTDAWRRKAPGSLAGSLDGPSSDSTAPPSTATRRHRRK